MMFENSVRDKGNMYGKEIYDYYQSRKKIRKKREWDLVFKKN